jgi:hypothetical protein
MTEPPELSSDALSRLTGSPSPNEFSRSCYCVRNHGDGTGTVVLNWYEVSNGQDYYHSDEYMRAELSVAKRVVELLNAQLPARVHATTVIDWPFDP